MSADSLEDSPLEHFAQVLARRDVDEGGHRHGGWGAAMVVWVTRFSQDHRGCGQIDLSAIQDFKDGKVDAIILKCPVHGPSVGPVMPR
jgi:hypothetical protein